MSQTLYVPCKVLSVDLTVGAADGLSPLERLTLEAIQAGVDDVMGLADFFYLGQRPMLDLLWDLWRRAYLTIELETGKVWLSEEVARHVQMGTLDELPGGEISEQEERVLQELLAGHLLRLQRRPKLTPDSRIIPASAMDDGELPLRRHELIGVLEQILPSSLARRAEGSVGRDARVLSVSVRRDSAERSTEQVLIEVTVESSVDPASGHLSLRVTGPSSLSGEARLDMQKSLERLADAMPSQPWVRQLRKMVVQEETAAEPDLLTVVGRLNDSVQTTAEDVDAALAQQEQRHAFGLAVLDRIRRARAGNMQFQALTTIEDQLTALSDLLGAATRQVVLSVPALDFDVVATLEVDVRRLLARDVRLVIVWGDRHAAEFSSDVANILDQLAAQTGRDPFWPETSSQIGTFTAIQDAERVLMSSASLLGPGLKPLSASAGMLVETQGTDTTFVTDVLTWIKRRCADSRTGVMIDTFSSYAVGAAAPALPTTPSPPLADEGDGMSAASLRLWHASWTAFSSQVVAHVRNLGWWAELVLDVEHRTQLWSLLRRDNRYLVIISRRFDAAVVNTAFFAALERKLQAGTRVFIGYADDRRAPGGGRLDSIAEGFARLQARYGALFHQAHVPASSIELIADDTALLLSSYAFLRDLGPDLASSDWKRPSHAGLLLRHAGGVAVVGPLLRNWGVPDAILFDLPDARAVLPDPGAPARLHDDLQVLLKSLARATREGDDERAALLREWFASRLSADDAWDDLEILREIAFADLDLAAAACIWARRLDAAPGHRNRWLARLATGSWRRGEIVEAALLLPPDDDEVRSAGLPPAWLAELVAEHVIGAPIAESLVDASLRDTPGAEEVTGLVSLATDVLLFDGAPKADDGLEVLLAHATVPAPLAAIGGAARTFFQATRAALPVEDIRAFSDAAGRGVEGEARYETLQNALHDARTISLRFELGHQTLEELFGDDDGLAPLIRAIEAEDARAVQGWLGDHGARRTDAEQLLDDATRRAVRKGAVWAGAEARLMGGKRTTCIARIHELLRDAAAWAETAILTVSKPSADLTDAVTALAYVLRDQRDALDALGRAEAFSAPLIQRLVARLAPLERWPC